MIKPIETRYKGYRFRSRLEARWAVFFDSLGLKWQYEPQGFETSAGRYLPDFFIEGNYHRGPYVEVKAIDPSKVEVTKLEDVCKALGAYGLIVWGQPGDERFIRIDKRLGAVFNYHLPMIVDFEHLLPQDNNRQQIIWGHAVTNARSARFEHGETP